MIYHGFKAVAVAGVAVPLASVPTPAAFVTVFYRTGNSGGEVRLGGASGTGHQSATTFPPTSIPSGSGAPLIAGSSNVVFPGNAVQQYDLSTIYVDADTNGDGVQFIYGR
jgi:hypothetical protein